MKSLQCRLSGPSVLLIFSFLSFSPSRLTAEEIVPQLPKFYLNSQPANVTIQDLSGLATRPLRLLIQRNNQARGEEWIQNHAIGVRVGDELRVEATIPLPGERATIYRILRSQRGGPRYLTMPVSVYYDEARELVYQEKIESFREEVLIVIFEKTDSPGEKNVNIRYFEERVRKLVIASYKTNLLLSSLKFKLKDFSDDAAGDFFERDGQLLIDRLIHPRRIFLIRLWPADK